MIPRKNNPTGSTGNISVLLHDIRSVYNVGSVFRTADAVGVKKIYISGYTPSPVDRFGRNRTDIAKVALGAELTVPWESAVSPVELIKKLKGEGMFIVVLEQEARSFDFRSIKETVYGKQVLLVLGSEVTGVDEKLLDLADVIAEIPMKGEKESLNVSVAAGIMLYELSNLGILQKVSKPKPEASSEKSSR